jgi:hypothetical protein
VNQIGSFDNKNKSKKISYYCQFKGSVASQSQPEYVLKNKPTYFSKWPGLSE